MDCEKLITLVQERRSLWDQKSKHYHNRALNKKLWNEVAENMNSTDALVRQKWRGLRDTFRKELSKLEQKRSGDPVDEIESKWHFFDNMSFVTEQFAARKSSGNISSGSTNTQSQSIFEGGEELSVHCPGSAQPQTQEENCMDTENEINKSLQTTPINKNKRPLTDNTSRDKNPPLRKLKNMGTRDIAMEKLITIKEEKLKQFKESASVQQQQHLDDDSYFLLSLVPYFKEFPNHRKLHVRAKFLHMLTEEHQTLFRSQGTRQQAGQVPQTFVPVPDPSPSYSISTDYSQHSSPAQIVNEDNVTYYSLQTAEEQQETTTSNM